MPYLIERNKKKKVGGGGKGMQLSLLFSCLITRLLAYSPLRPLVPPFFLPA